MAGESPTPEPDLPSDYQRIEYVERPAGTSASRAFNTTAFAPNDTDECEIRIGFMTTSAPTSSFGYVLCGGQRTTDNTVGFGVCVNKAMTQAGCYGGADCFVNVSCQNVKFDAVAKRSPTKISYSDGTRSNQVSLTPRSVARNFHVFCLPRYNYDEATTPFFGRIYYCTIIEGGVTKVNMLPCRKKSNNAIGFYDTVKETFRTSAYYVAGPDVN